MSNPFGGGTKSGSGSKPLLKASILAPSKFGAPSAPAAASTSKVSFPGLKQSKLSNLPISVSSSTSLTSNDKPKSDEEAKVKIGFIPLEINAENNGSANDKKSELIGSAEKEKKPETKSTEDKSESSFVFGQNLNDRAQNFVFKEEEKTEKEVKTDSATDDKNALAASKTDESTKSPNPSSTEKKKTLADAAAEYCESRTPKRKYEEVKVVTGEEDERNVVQMNAKLHVFDKATSGWLERGRGCLRLNDVLEKGDNSDEKQQIATSRLVMRTSGSLRVILNTPVFAGTTVENPTEKTVRLTGSDEGGQVKIFVVGGQPKDIAELYSALIKRKNHFQKMTEVKKDRKEEDGGDKS